MTCCTNQRPRISEQTGRVFCASCRAYLDRGQAVTEPLRATEPEKTSIAPSTTNAVLEDDRAVEVRNRQIELGLGPDLFEGDQS